MSLRSYLSAVFLTLAVSGCAPSTPQIVEQPLDLIVVVGATAKFSVGATGPYKLSYQWQRNGTAISGATSSTYTVVAMGADNGALFGVIVSDQYAKVTSNSAKLTVTSAQVAPSITTQPASQSIVSGQTASFSVVATGTAPLSYQWQKNGTAINGATSATYTNKVTDSDNSSQFAVIVSNVVGNVTSDSATLTVSAAPVAPSITTQPLSQTVAAGQMAAFSIVAAGTPPLSYQWQKNGVAVSGATSTTYTNQAVGTDSGSQFTAIVTNSVGNATSNPATLTVTPISVAPSITTQPASQTVIAGQTATFGVVASGTPPLSYQWLKNGTAISGATSTTYTNKVADSDNSSQFTVTASNAVGTVTSDSATLTVTPAPCNTLSASQGIPGQSAGIVTSGAGTSAPASTQLNGSQQPGSVLVFHKFVRGSAGCVPATEFEISVHCPLDVQPCQLGTAVTLVAHWVCPGQAETQICKQTNFTLHTTVEGTITFNTENLSGFGTVRVPPPPCPEGYLILWVVDSRQEAIKFDGLVGDATLRWNDHAASQYNALTIQAASSLATYALTDVNQDDKMQLDGTEYHAVTGAVLGTLRYDAPTHTDPDTPSSTSLTLLTLDVLANRPNNPVFADIDFYDANENVTSESVNFVCWADIPLESIDPSLVRAIMGRQGFFNSGAATKVASEGIADSTGPVTLVGVIDTVECTAPTATSCSTGVPVPSGDDAGITNHYVIQMGDDSVPVPTTYVPNDGTI